jgi:hypothetical protein
MTHFLFQEGEWSGHGNVFFATNPEVLSFNTTWSVSSLDKRRFRAVQTVRVDDHDPMINTFTITKEPSGDFQVYLENESIGVFSGHGVSDERRVAWEFTHYGALEGMEVYEQTHDNVYDFHAEYLGEKGTCTTIRGTIKPN